MSIRTIAEQLGVSPATVSLALKGDARVSQATRQRVLEHCRQHKFTPRFSARSLSLGRSFTLHLVQLTDPESVVSRFLIDFLSGATSVAGASGYRIVVSFQTDQQLPLLQQAIRDGSADGFIVLNPLESQDYQCYQDGGGALLVVGRSAAQGALSVDSDNVAVGRDIGAHLKERSYRRPLLLGPDQRTFTLDRLQGLRLHFSDTPLAATSGALEQVRALALAAIQAGHDALVVTEDPMLPAVLQAVRAACAQVPKVGVVGMGNDLSAYLDPDVTSVDFHARQLGEQAAQRLIAQLQTPSSERQPHHSASHHTVSHRIVARASTARTPGGTP